MSHSLLLPNDRLGVSGNKFYCTIRANHSVNRGTWYFEAKIVDLPEGAATRIGWAQKNANLQAPLGFDKFGYSCRSRKGTKFHEAIGITNNSWAQSFTSLIKKTEFLHLPLLKTFKK